MALEQSYTSTPAGSPGSGASSSAGDTAKYWQLGKLRRCVTGYLSDKRQEIDEQIDARRYYHGSQYTAQQLAQLKKRRQPAMTFNRIARKIDGVVGLIEKLRQDPKAYARTPEHAEGADLATAALRYVLDEQEWKAQSPQCASDGAVDGIGGMEIVLEQGDQGDPEIGLEIVDVPSFFYDPRSFKDDFSDAQYMGIGKWLSLDTAKAMFPDAPESAFSGNDYELTNNSDREVRWFSSSGNGGKRVRVVELWYKHNGGWCYSIFSGTNILQEGQSYLKNEKGKEICKYIMFSGNVDQDGDRYGFIRNMKSAQDGINAKQSKMQHIIASKRIILSQGSVDDIEKTRAEWARPDGVVITNRPVNEGVKLDDQTFDFAGLEKLLQLNLQEIENFGPNPQLLGDRDGASSGRAIALLQQAGMAELGPYIQAYRGWKIRLYRAIWNAVQQHWKAERWVRVTDDQQLAQYIQINGLQMGPDGKPSLVNAVGSLDVDIILDEGPDHVNQMADVYETLSNILPSIAPVLTPQKAALVVDTLIETSPLDSSIKKKFREQSEQQAQQPPPPDPAIEAAKAKSEIDLQTQQQSAQLEGQRAQQANADKANAAQIDLEHKRQAAQLDIEAKAHSHQLEIEHTHAKNKVALDHENQKASVQIGAKHEESKIKHGEMRAKAEHELTVVNEKAAKTDMGQMKTIVDAFSASLKDIAKTVETAVEKANEPKSIKVQRDKTGKVTGAVAS